MADYEIRREGATHPIGLDDNDIVHFRLHNGSAGVRPLSYGMRLEDRTYKN